MVPVGRLKTYPFPHHVGSAPKSTAQVAQPAAAAKPAEPPVAEPAAKPAAEPAAEPLSSGSLKKKCAI